MGHGKKGVSFLSKMTLADFYREVITLEEGDARASFADLNRIMRRLDKHLRNSGGHGQYQEGHRDLINQTIPSPTGNGGQEKKMIEQKEKTTSEFIGRVCARLGLTASELADELHITRDRMGQFLLDENVSSHEEGILLVQADVRIMENYHPALRRLVQQAVLGHEELPPEYEGAVRNIRIAERNRDDLSAKFREELRLVRTLARDPSLKIVEEGCPQDVGDHHPINFGVGRVTVQSGPGWAVQRVYYLESRTSTDSRPSKFPYLSGHGLVPEAIRPSLYERQAYYEVRLGGRIYHV